MALGYHSFDDLSELIKKAQIEYSPKFTASESDDQFLGDLESETELESRRLIYVALTRAREKLVIEWPSFLAGKDTLTYWSILAGEAAVSKPDKTISIGDSSFPCLIWDGESELPEEIDESQENTGAELLTVGRRAIKPGQLPEEQIPDSVTPSGMVASTDTVEGIEQTLETAQYSQELDLDIGLSGTVLGTFLHQCFEILGANPGQAENIATITDVELSDDARISIAESVACFEQWMADYFSATAVHRELPLLGVDENDSVVSGTADLVLETDGGMWIIDHKSDQVEDAEEAFNSYRPQLECYSNLLQSMGHNVLGIGINWIRRGVVVLAGHSAE
jgi:ATP-dependent exoDNAse (exonuclease V) beta subunit